MGLVAPNDAVAVVQAADRVAGTFTGLVGHKHWSAFCRFFSRASWSIDELRPGVARLIVDHLVPRDAPIRRIAETADYRGSVQQRNPMVPLKLGGCVPTAALLHGAQSPE